MASKTTSNVTVNYDDKRYTEVNNDKQQALTDLENVYGGMVEEADKYYQAQIDASKQWAETQSQIQKQETDFAIQQVEQQKEQTQKDYTREQYKKLENLVLEKHTVDIGILLQRKVHAKFHSIYGVKNNTIEQFNEFIENHYPKKNKIPT